MTNWRVTITGADDAVEPEELAKLSQEFPFVEWGLLCSRSREGTPRYPSQPWKSAFFGTALLYKLRVAAHFCGPLARETMTGEARPAVHPWVQRVQINGFAVDKAAGMPPDPRCEFILQVRAEEDLQGAANYILACPSLRASILFDPSGGRGIEPFRWPCSPSGVRMGYAGGITPDNVLDVLRAIGPVEPTWIDMESGVRTDDRFDLGKVRRVLEQVAALG